MELISRKVKSLLKRVSGPDVDRFDLFTHDVIMAFLTKQLSPEQVKVVSAFLQKEGYLA